MNDDDDAAVKRLRESREIEEKEDFDHGEAIGLGWAKSTGYRQLKRAVDHSREHNGNLDHVDMMIVMDLIDPEKDMDEGERAEFWNVQNVRGADDAIPVTVARGFIAGAVGFYDRNEAEIEKR